MATSYVDPSGILYLGGGFVEPVNTPEAFGVVVTSASATSLNLSWADQAADYYRVWIGLDPQAMQLAADRVQALQATLSGLTQGSKYFLQVTAYFGARDSTASLILKAVPATAPFPPITWDPANTAVFVLSDGNKTATAPNTSDDGATQAASVNVPDLAYAEVLVGSNVPPSVVYGDTSLEIGVLGFYVSQTGQQEAQANIYTLPKIVPGDVIGIAWSNSSGNLWLAVNNTYFNDGDPATNTNPTYSGGATGPILISAFDATDGTDQNCFVTLRSQLSEFTQPVPAGFGSWSGG